MPASHFLVALAWLVAGSIGLVLVAPSLARGAWLSSGVAATVHAFTLGWLLTSAYGALYQLGPVVLGIQPRSPRLVWVVLLLHTIGTGLLVAGLGFWQPRSIGGGWVLVALALGLWSWNLGGAFRRSARSPMIGAHVTAAYAALWLTLALAGVRIGNVLGWWMVPRESLVVAHVQLAAVGFGGLLVIGLGSRLFPMFLMNRSTVAWPSRWCGPLVVAGVFAQVAGWLGGIAWPVTGGGMLIALGAALFLYQAARWVTTRARRSLDYPLQQLVTAFALLAATVVLGLAILWTPTPRLVGAYGVLLIVGWITLVIGAVYGRVLPFLTWLERFSPRAGARRGGAEGGRPAATVELPPLDDSVDVRSDHPRRRRPCRSAARGRGWRVALRPWQYDSGAAVSAPRPSRAGESAGMTNPFTGPVVSLDVRPLLAEGVEPFDAIMAAVESLPAGGVLELTAPFDPVPLYKVLGGLGFVHQTFKRGPAEVVVYFSQAGSG